MSDVNAPDPGAPPQDAAPAAGNPVASDAPASAVTAAAESPGPAAASAPHAEPDDRPAARASVEPPADDHARRRDKGVGTAIVVVAFLLSLAISLWAKHASRPEVSDPPQPPTTEGVVGFPSAVDAVATLPAARRLTKRPMLRGMVLEGVAVNGTVDLNQVSTGRVKYSFQSPAGHGAQPPREPGTLPRQHFCGRQTVTIKKGGVAADPDRPEAICTPKSGEPLPDPQCALRDLWQAAIKRGVPSDRLARIEYYRSSAGPAWRFELPGTKHRFSLHGDCQRELTGPEAQNL